jgi:molecular chaperone HtpG
LTEKEIFEDELDHEIKVTTDDSANTLTIQDFGLGMDKDELIENLGTIAHSGLQSISRGIESRWRKK